MTRPLPEWATWSEGSSFTVGAEEEIMLLHPGDWSLAQQSARALDALREPLGGHVSAETQGAVVELTSSPHPDVAALAAELMDLRKQLESELSMLGLQPASAGTHAFTVWQETVVSSAPRYQAVYGSMRELARREPTFALHVHVGISDPDTAIRTANRLRVHLPVLLALSANSPFWQGRDTGLASARTPLFQAFPRVGVPQAFDSYDHYVESVDMLIRCDAVPEPTFLWWDVRPQPRFGTVEVRIMDAQTRLGESAAIAALVQSVVRAEVEGSEHLERPMPQEVLAENRFLAARDGMEAELIEPELGRRVPARELLADLVSVCRPHAEALDCTAELDRVIALGERTGAQRQLEQAAELGSMPRLVAALADDFVARD
jgi:glutamate---cysteine ligase / carboxylate-amine ligase